LFFRRSRAAARVAGLCDDVGRLVRDAYAALGRVLMLPALPARAERVDAALLEERVVVHRDLDDATLLLAVWTVRHGNSVYFR